MNKGQKGSALVIGGTSGLGLGIARALQREGRNVFVTGRHDPKEKGLEYLPFLVTEDAQKASTDLDDVLRKTGPLGMLVSSAGFFEDGTLDLLDDAHILTTLNIGMATPALLMSKVLRLQQKLDGVIFITSTSQWIPRLREPLYSATKAGLAMLGNSIALDPRVAKTLIVGPGGMDTSFWRGEKRTGTLLDPAWVADETLRLFKETHAYTLVRIIREPRKIEILEQR